MEIEIKIDKACRIPRMILITDKMTDEINNIVKRLSEERPEMIAGFREDMLELLEQPDIIRIYAYDGKVFAVTSKGEYVLRMRLYELENRLGGSSFVRISKSEIVNLKKVKKFDLSFAGTICVLMRDGSTAYVSRRYVKKIKEVLGI